MVPEEGRVGGRRRFTGVNMTAHLAPPNRQGAAMQKTILVCNITLHCACREATTSNNSEKKIVSS